MLRWTVLLIAAVAVAGTAASAAEGPIVIKRGAYRATSNLPAGLPRPYYKYRPGTPLLPGSSTIPGYYGRAFDYDYQGPYYGGPYVGYWNRLPYACGVYGYC